MIVPDAVICIMAGSPPPIEKPRKARYTIDFEVETLKALKHFAVDLEVDASDILKYLVARVTEDGEWRREVEREFTRSG